MAQSGIVLFSQVNDTKFDDQLFGSLMSALNSFAEELSEGGLSNFELSNKRYTILKKNQLLFIASSSKIKKEKKVMKDLRKITSIFFQKFPKNLIKNWDNDVSIFDGFENEISTQLQEPMKQFWTSF